MDMAIVYSAIGFGGLASVVALFLFISRARLQESLSTLNDKLIAEQSRKAEASIRTVQKPASTPKASPESSKSSQMLMDLRKQNAHLKDELKQLKQTLRESEVHLKDADERTDAALYKIRAENAALVEKLKELELNSPDKVRAAGLEEELNILRERNRSLNQEIKSSSQQLKTERTQLEQSKKQVESLQNEIQALRVLVPNTDPATLEAAKKFDPKILERWRDRAYTARHMYKMMRQMRELSDIKLSTYQEAVVDVSSCLLALKGVSQPELAPNELKADRYLAEAWALIQPELSPAAASHSTEPSSQTTDTHMNA
jgi:chromosome segregation ATPase